MRNPELKVHSITLAKGARLHILPTDKFKTNLLSMSFVAPLRKSTAAANALIPNILMRGSVNYPDMASINKRLDYLYAAEMSTRNSRRGNLQLFGISADMLDNSYAPDGEDITAGVADMLGELLFNPITDGEAFDANYTESEKANLIDSINAEINNKAVYADRRCLEIMCADEPFGLTESGKAEDVELCTPESVWSQYKFALSHYPIEFFFVGQCDESALAERLTGMLEELADKGIERDPIELANTEIKLAADEIKRVSEDMPVNQGKLVLGMRSGTKMGDEDYFAFMLFNAIFGGSVTSKLFMNVRERMSLCYYCQSAPEPTSGILLVRSGIEVANREIAEGAILDQLEAVKRGDFTDEELESSLLFLVNSYRELADSASGLRSYYFGRLLSGLESTPEDEIEALRSVTREQIIAAANKVTVDTVYFLNGTINGEGGECEDE